MTVETTAVSKSYKPGAAMAPEAIPFAFLDAADIVVTRIAGLGGARTPMVSGQDYTIGGDGRLVQGSITALFVLPADDVFLVERSTVPIQSAAIPPHQPIPAGQVEQQLDRMAMHGQEQAALAQRTQDRALLAPEGEALAPLAGVRSGRFVGFGADPDKPLMLSGTGADGALRDDLADGPGARLVNYEGRALDAKLREIVSIADFQFGASTAKVDNSANIQSAIDYVAGLGGGEVFVPSGSFAVAPQPHPGLAGTFGANSVCIHPRSNVKLIGPGTIRLAAGTGGPSGAVIGNWNGLPIENFVAECRIDGNRWNTIGSMSGIVIVYGTNCAVRHGYIYDCSFCGVQFAKGSVSCTVVDMRIESIGYIAIQFQQADAAKITFNKLFGCVDNAIDCEANNGALSRNIILANSIKMCATGIFLESGGNTNVSMNDIEGTDEAAIWLNRINNGAEDCIISANTMRQGAGAGRRGGIYMNNNCGKSSIDLNRLDGYRWGMFFEGATNKLAIGRNYLKNIRDVLVYAPQADNSFLKSFVDNLIYEGPLSGPAGKERFPYTYSPTTNPANFPGRDFNVTVKSMWNLDAGGPRSQTSSEDEYRTGVAGNLVANPAWGNAYSIFFNGETLVYWTGTPMQGNNYAIINGTVFMIFGTGAAGEFKVRSAAGVAGDYHNALNNNYAFVEYWTEWQTF